MESGHPDEIIGPDAAETPRVGLLVTCLVDLLRPSIARASIRLLEAAGCRVTIPRAQTCCGQPAYNSGDMADARALARRVIRMFNDVDYIVVPSGSCAAMLRHHYPALLEPERDWHAAALDIGQRTWELTAFLSKVGFQPNAYQAGAATYHDGCSGLREMAVHAQPRDLLAGCRGLELTEMKETERCCGFGGTFCVKYDAISSAMGRHKLDRACETGAGMVISGELGCLLHLAGLAEAEGRRLAFRHIAEILAAPAKPKPGTEDGT